MKAWSIRASLCLAASAALTLATITYSSFDYLHASKWFPDVPLHASDYRRVKTWGWPLHFIGDSPLGQKSELIDFGDDFHLDSALFDWGLWAIAIAVLAITVQKIRSSL
jgi:hypothetical protein